MRNILQVFKAQLQYLTEKQKVTAENLSRVHLAGEKAYELKEPDFKSILGQIDQSSAKTTHEGHIGSGASQKVKLRRALAPVTEKTLSGGTISLEKEMMEASKTHASTKYYNTLIRKYSDMIKLVTSG